MVATALVGGAVAGDRIRRAVPLEIVGCAPPTGLSTILPLGFLLPNSVQLYFAWLRSAKLQLHLGSFTFHKFALAPPKSLPMAFQKQSLGHAAIPRPRDPNPKQRSRCNAIRRGATLTRIPHCAKPGKMTAKRTRMLIVSSTAVGLK